MFGCLIIVAQVNAQNALAPLDEKLRKDVQAGLHASPYFYDRHITVSMENGSVVLRGFVFSDWDLRQALSIARKAAEDKTVIDDLSIKEGGR
jgi:osmotically-inducible protein OsmY